MREPYGHTRASGVPVRELLNRNALGAQGTVLWTHNALAVLARALLTRSRGLGAVLAMLPCLTEHLPECYSRRRRPNSLFASLSA